MNEQKTFFSGVAAGLFLMLAASSGNWLISPLKHSAPGAPPVWGVALQGVTSLTIAVWLYRRQRRKHPQALAAQRSGSAQ